MIAPNPKSVKRVGGAKAPGIGREGGIHSLILYSERSNICVKF
jgi:hypothetical protein